MSKYLIVLDKLPESCSECNFAVDGRCVVNNKFILYEVRHNEMARSCPANMCMAMEAERQDSHTISYVSGWNDCMRHHNMV